MNDFKTYNCQGQVLRCNCFIMGDFINFIYELTDIIIIVYFRTLGSL